MLGAVVSGQTLIWQPIHDPPGAWGFILDGEVTWHGEAPNDIGKIVVTNNQVEEQQGRVVYGWDLDG